MKHSYKKGDRVEVISEVPVDGLIVGAKGYVIREVRSWRDGTAEVAVMFDEAFRGGVDFDPVEGADQAIIDLQVVKAGERIHSRSSWVKVGCIAPAYNYARINWIE